MLSALPFVSAALDPAQYLYEGESASAISTVDFTIASSTSAYKLVSISGAPAFLLKDGEPIRDAAAAQAALKEYYSKTAYLSATELSELKTKVASFNASRNFMTNYGPAESTCKQNIGLGLRPCNSLASCTQLASIVCSLFGTGGGCDVSILASYTYDYSKNVKDLDDRINSATSALNTMTFETASEKLETIELSLNGAKDAASKIKTSKLRFPAPGDTCMDCIGVCPTMKFDIASIDAAISAAGTYKRRVEPLKNLGQTAASLVAAEDERLTYKLNTALYAIYSAKFDAIKNTSGNVSEEAELAALTVADEQFAAMLVDLREAKAKIDTGLALRNFTSMNESLSIYQSAAAQLNEALLNNFTAPYMELEDAQDTANDKLLAASWGIDKNDAARLEGFVALATRKSDIDRSFDPPMTAGQYNEFGAAYLSLAVDTEKFMASGNNAQKTVLGLGTSIGQKSVDGAMAITATMTPVNFKTRQRIAPYIPPVVLFLTDLSLLSMALIVFVGGMIYFRGVFAHKIVLGAWVLGLVAFAGFLLIGTVAFYYGILGQSSNMASFTEFFSQVQSSPSGSVISDISAATAEGVVAMDSCSSQIEGQLLPMGKSVRRFEINGGTCRFLNVTNETNVTVEVPANDCLGMIADEPVFYLSYSETSLVPQFSVVVQKQATIVGNAEYHERCDIANVLG